MERKEELIQQIAIDVAVIKSQLHDLKEMGTTVSKNSEDIARLATQLYMLKWFGGFMATGLFGVILRIFFH